MLKINIVCKYENKGIITHYKIKDIQGRVVIISKDVLISYNDREFLNAKMSVNGRILSKDNIPTVSINVKILYHGSDRIIREPIYGYGKVENDYGLGFYCTENLNLAREWSCSSGVSGIVNRYDLILNDLRVLVLKKNSQKDILTWLSILLENRTFNLDGKLSQRSRDFILDNYKINYRDYDVIVGYRADDSYFRYARDFINGTISYEKFSNAIFLGKLGMQVVLISKKAFSQIIFTGSENVSNEYISRYIRRDKNARLEYSKMKDTGNTTIVDIMGVRR